MGFKPKFRGEQAQIITEQLIAETLEINGKSEQSHYLVHMLLSVRAWYTWSVKWGSDNTMLLHALAHLSKPRFLLL